jgi:hypothetical protein
LVKTILNAQRRNSRRSKQIPVQRHHRQKAIKVLRYRIPDR